MLDFSVTFIITIINIAILFFILRAILFKPVTKFMAERTKRIQDSIDQAERDKAIARKMLADYENKLEKAEIQAQEILKKAHENALHQTELLIADGKKEADSIIAAAHKQIEAEHQAALTKFRLEAAALVIAASSRLASKDFGGDDNIRYANMLLEEIAQRSRKGDD